MTEHSYTREGRSLPPVPDQQEMLRRAGVTALDTERDRAYLDKQPRRLADPPRYVERDNAIRACRPGDVLWVPYACTLGHNAQECLAALLLVTERGATVRVATTGETYTGHPAAAAAVAFALLAESEAKSLRMSKAQAAARKRTDRKKVEEKKVWDRAKAMWPDLRFTVAQITAETGIRPRTLYNAQDRGELPRRDAQPFSGGPLAKRKGPNARSR